MTRYGGWPTEAKVFTANATATKSATLTATTMATTTTTMTASLACPLFLLLLPPSSPPWINALLPIIYFKV